MLRMPMDFFRHMFIEDVDRKLILNSNIFTTFFGFHGTLKTGFHGKRLEKHCYMGDFLG